MYIVLKLFDISCYITFISMTLIVEAEQPLLI